MLKRRFNKRGLTLVELMIVVGIIAFLTLIATIYLRSQSHKGNDARRKADLRRISIAVEEYEKDNNCYPLSTLMTCNPGNSLDPYLNKIPCDPVSNSSYVYEHEDSACPKWYRIYAKLDVTNDPDYVANIGPNSSYSYYYASPNAPAVTGGTQSNYYGCVAGACVPIGWDNSRPGPACDPNFQNSSCYDQCGSPANNCVSWH